MKMNSSKISPISVFIVVALIFMDGCTNDTKESTQYKTGNSIVNQNSAAGSTSPVKPSTNPSTSGSSTQATTPPIQTDSKKKSSAPFIKARYPLPAIAYDWKKGVESPFEYDFVDRCVFPSRVKYTDRPLTNGTLLDELFKIRSLFFYRYIFLDEVEDLDPRKFVKSFSSFEDYFEIMTGEDSYLQQMRTKVKREDGLPKHGMFEVLIEKERVETDVPPRPWHDFGIIWDKRSDTPPRDYVVKFVNPDSPGMELANGEPKVKRGDKILMVNDIDFQNAVDQELVRKIESGLLPNKKSDVTKFQFIDRDTKRTKTVFLNPTAERYLSHEFTKVIETDNGLVGYINISDSLLRFDRLYESIKSYKKNRIKDVIIDIRYYNRREDEIFSSKFEPMLLYTVLGKANTDGKQFRYRVSRNGHSEYNIFPYKTPFFSNCVPRSAESKEREFCDENARTYKDLISIFGCPSNRHICDNLKFDLQSLNLNRVFLLTSKETCHIGELIINGLLGIDVEVILVGEQTCGSPYLAEDFLRNCGIIYKIIDTEFLNHKQDGEYHFGFSPENSKSKYGVKVPGCYIRDDFLNDLGSKEEAMLAAALRYRKDGSCPKVPK